MEKLSIGWQYPEWASWMNPIDNYVSGLIEQSGISPGAIAAVLAVSIVIFLGRKS